MVNVRCEIDANTETGISPRYDPRGGRHQKRRGLGRMRIFPNVSDRSLWAFGESIKAFFTGATHSLSAAISILEGDFRSAWGVVKAGGSVGEFSICERRGEYHV